MNIKYFECFIVYEEKGLKKQATESIREFIASFQNTAEIEHWVWEYLPTLKKNNHSRIRHELFNELIYPILKTGYEKQDFQSILWLGKVVQNLYQSRKLYKEFIQETELSLFIKSYKINPENDEARLLLLNATIKWLKYTEHEWPSGILYGNDGATLEECNEIDRVVKQAVELDKELLHQAFIAEYQKKLSEYRSSLDN
ncbi:hypothetical protein NT239_04460 [Chitinibacter sp. SCUT-21]|uniref:hypothetical protein n=1 Tax=Chitinibacter sp. SCUT-21 TaxID=2970891 RepID=UPI0035A5C728